jgi:hypothetical protein
MGWSRARSGFWRLVVKDRRSSISTGERLRLLGNDEPAADASSFETQSDVRVDANIHHVSWTLTCLGSKLFVCASRDQWRLLSALYSGSPAETPNLHRPLLLPAFPAEEVFDTKP